jgi:hypothetical protein
MITKFYIKIKCKGIKLKKINSSRLNTLQSKEWRPNLT